MSIRVWLSVFVMLFAIAELFEWLAELGSWQPTGVWLILGGMGLAALSNAARLPKISVSETLATEAGAKGGGPAKQPSADAAQKATGSNQPVAQVSAASTDASINSDSISFKVRPLKR